MLLASALIASAAEVPRVQLGSEVLAAGGFKELAGRRVGLITNPSGVSRRLESTIEVLRRAPGVKLVALFGPEHGIYGDVPAGDKVESRTDVRTGLPVHSLYGATRKPTAAMLRELDVVVYDLQDTGSRSYTFISTMGLAMEACAEAGVEFIVLDRPNPLGGLRVEGPRLGDERLRSFVSQWNVPYVYGLTCGELARMINGSGWLKKPCRLTVVPMRGWTRPMAFDQTGLPWVMPSPNLPTFDSAIVYPGTVLFEGTNVSEGRGTTRPFELVGAPWVYPETFAASLNAKQLPGVYFRPAGFEPTFQKHARKPCGGCQVHVTDRQRFRPLDTAVALIEAFRATGGDRFQWRDPPYEYEATQMPIDILYGSSGLRDAFAAGATTADITTSWTAPLEAFRPIREKFLLY